MSNKMQVNDLEALRISVLKLNDKYNGIFDPLVIISKIITQNSSEYKRIEKLLKPGSIHGEIIQLYNQGFGLKQISKKLNLTYEIVRTQFKECEGFYKVINMESWCIQALENLDNPPTYKDILKRGDDSSILVFKKVMRYWLAYNVNSQKSKVSDLIKKFSDSQSYIPSLQFEFRKIRYIELLKLLSLVESPEYWGSESPFVANLFKRAKASKKLKSLDMSPSKGETPIAWIGRILKREFDITSESKMVKNSQGKPQKHYKYIPPDKTELLSLIDEYLDIHLVEGLKQFADWCNDKPAQQRSRVTLSYVKDFVRSLGDSLYHLTPAEIYVLFEQQRINKANNLQSRRFDKLVGAIQSGNLPREEIEKWLSDQKSDVVDSLVASDDIFPEDSQSQESTFSDSGVFDSQLNIETGYQEDIEQNLPLCHVRDTLNSLSLTTDLLQSSSSDGDAISFLIAKAKAKLWKHCFEDEEEAIEEAKSHQGNIYSEAIRNSFLEEYTSCRELSLPDGYSSFKPKLMQRLIAYRVLTEHRVLNLSGTGTGKTLSAILASRVIDSKLTVITCPNATIETSWRKTIIEAFPQSDICVKTWEPKWKTDYDQPRYLIINHEMFQNSYKSLIKEFIQDNQIDFIVIDELHQVKQRDLKAESQRRYLIKALITAIQPDQPKPRVLGMSATPIINNIQEGKSLIELVSSEEQEDIGSSITIPNCMKIYQKLTTMGFRMIPKNKKSRQPNIYPVDATFYLESLLELGGRPHPQQVEAILVQARWPIIKQHLRKSTVIFTEYVKDIVPYITEKIQQETEFSVGTYTGDEKYSTKIGYENILEQFRDKEVDILVASIHCLGTGVDGLQSISNNVIFATLPWTHANYEQAIGRFDREGSTFDSLDIHIPKTYAILKSGEEWSWCQSRINRLENKQDIARAAVDGEIPDTNAQFTPAKATQYWMGWLKRLNEEGLHEVDRKEIRVPLWEDDERENHRRYASYGDFSSLNARWNNSHSSTTHQRLCNNPEEWCFYHTRMSELEVNWHVNPREECIKHLKINIPIGSYVGDFGCGQAKLADALKDLHTVYSFDHIAINDNVIACDMSCVPLDNSSLDAAVFSLSLMGSNFKDYLIEAYRVLKPGGQILIYNPAQGYDHEKFIEDLLDLKFAVIKSGEIYKWYHIWGIKQG